jgi:protein N-terminal methyltransferase
MNAELLDGKPTPINLANHSYFNLASHNSSSGVLDHRLTMPSNFYTPTDANSIPTRQVQSLDEDPAMDFRGGRLLKDALVEYGLEKAGLSEEEAAQSVALSWISTDRAKSGSTAEVQVGPNGFDHNYVVNHDGPGMTVAGIVDHEPTRRRLTVLTDTPGVQLYTANWVDGKLLDKRYCKDASVYRQWQAICLETQHFPDSIGVDPDEFPDFAKGQCFILRPGGPNYEHNVEYRFESIPRGSSESTASAKTPVLSISEKGTDSDGNVYNSIDEMWRSQGVEQSDGATNSSWYSKAEDYYEENCDATINGVLGGFAAISDLDLEGSGKFIERVRRERPSLDLSSGAACECGAGIGRVSKGLLLPLGVPRCDLVESSSRLLSAAPAYIGDPGADRCRYYCAGLQDWEPPKDTYSIIWIQWVLCYLTDIDVIKFLRRCGQALRAEGIIVLKENTCEDDNFVLDNEDASVTRSLPYLLKLVDEAGLCVVVQDIQDDLPGELFPVPMLALDVKSKR